MKKKKILNMIMAIAVVVIMISGIMTVGSIKGWFEKDSQVAVTQENSDGQSHTVSTGGLSAVTANKVGGVNIQRSGVAYALENNTKLRNGDIIQTLNGAQIDLNYGNTTVGFNENSEAEVAISDQGELTISVKGGELFVNASDLIRFNLMDREISASSGVFSISVPYGSANIYIYENALTMDGEVYKSGENVMILQDGVSSSDLELAALNSFNIEKVRLANEEKTLCFSNAQLDKLAADREAAAQAETDALLLEAREEAQIEQQRTENKQKLEEAKKAEETASASGSSSSSEDDDDTKNSESSSGSSSGSSKTCTITIKCDTILDNMDSLKEGKNKYVPSNGTILAKSKVSFSDGDTVFDVLKKACSLAGIQLEYSWTPMYNSYYIEGINHLYEFDCGSESGWMYKVNGWFPNYGCSSYDLKDGDNIVWCYTCKGLGADVGASN